MYKTQAQALEFLQVFKAKLDETEDFKEVLLCVPFTDLSVVSKILHGGIIRLGAQNIHWEAEGAFTGEISGQMLEEIGVDYVIVGHSERRQHFAESDRTVNLRLLAAQKAGLTPILCVGETKQQRDANQTEEVITNQLKYALPNVDQKRLVIAYEPIWAIGTGETCASTEANRVIKLIRSRLSNFDVTIQYGGSVKPDNIDEIMGQPEIDGVLVGGASLDPIGFARIVNYQ